MKKKTCKNGLAVLLVIALVVTSFPSYVFGYTVEDNLEPASALEDQSTAKDNIGNGLPEGYLIGELEENRERSIKHFLKDDGTYEAVVYPNPVHFNLNDTWQDIDNTLVEVDSKDLSGEKVFKNKKNAFDVEFSKNADSAKTVSISMGEYSINWGLIGTQKAGIEVTPFDEAALDEQLIREITGDTSGDKLLDSLTKDQSIEFYNEKLKSLTNLSSSVLYKNVFQDIDLSYNLNSNQVKENIILNAPTGISTFEFAFNVKNLIPQLQEDGSIWFIGAGTDKDPIFVMQAPYMYDSNGEMSESIEATLSETKDGYILCITPDSTWLGDERRAYPVTIDPPITTSLDRTDIFDAHVSEAYPSTNYQNSYILKTGYGTSSGINRSYLKFTLPELSSASMITDAKMTLYNLTTVSTPRQVNIHKITESWSSATITWNNRPTYSSTISDYQLIEGELGAAQQFEITDLVKGWYTDGSNNGIVIKNQDESTGYMDYLSSDCSDSYASYRPQINLYYINGSGLEGYWTFHSQSIGRAGSGNINDYNGNLVYTHTDISMSGSRLPITVRHIYNSNSALDLNAIGYGKGWRTNYDQRVISVTIDGDLYYYYLDEDGTKHYFYWDTEDEKYKDENGLNIVLTITKVNGDITGYKITDKSDNYLTFNADGYLTKITDNNDNETVITYNSTNDITLVTDPSGREVDYILVDRVLEGIYDTEGRYYDFEYNTSGDLISIEYPDGKMTTFEYNSSHLMTEANNFDGQRLQYSYTDGSAKRVDWVQKSYVDGTSVTNGDSLAISYGSNTTVLTDSSDRSYIYQFNDWGNTVNTRDNWGYAGYTQYNETSGSASKNRATLSSKVQRTGTNFLKNHNMELNTDWVIGAWTGSTGSGAFSSAAQYIGDESFYVQKDNNISTQYCLQKVDLSPGYTYTLSGYVKTVGISNGNNKGANLLVRYQDNTGAWQSAISEYVSGTNNWQRLYVTFTLPSDAAGNEVWIRGAITEETGGAYFDCMQLEAGYVGNRYNLIENGDFRGGSLSSWTESSANGSSDMLVDLGYSPTDWVDPNAYKMVGDAQSHKYLVQTIDISGTSSDTFILSGWGKAQSVPLVSGTDRRFGLMVGFVPTSGSTVYVAVPFNTDASTWQYAANVVKSTGDFDHINVYCRYYDNANTAYFDGIRLFKEEFGQSYTYDADGNLISNKDLNTENSTFDYNSNNDLVSATDPVGGVFDYAYYANRNLWTATTAEDVVYGFAYDSAGNPTITKVRNPENTQYIKTTATYTTSKNYVASITDPSGNTITNSWTEDRGILDSTTDARGSTTSYTYGPLTDRLVTTEKTVGGESVSVGYGYSDDRLGRITRNEFNYMFGYDGFGNNTTVGYGTASPYTNLITNTFQAQTNLLLSTAYANGDDVSFTYDSLDRVISRKYEGITRFFYKYDNTGNLGYFEDQILDVQYRFLYDISDRLISVTDSNGNVMKNSYDANSNIKSISDTINGVNYYSTFTYDKDNRCTAATGGSGTTLRKMTTAYDVVGRISSKVMSYGGNDIFTTTYDYRPGYDSSLTTRVGSVTNGSETPIQYRYDENGNIYWTWQTGIYDIHYYYDELNQLIRENCTTTDTNDVDYTKIYTYDEGGNIETQETFNYVAGQEDPGTALSTISYQYDTSWKDKLTSYNGQSITYDAIGNPISYLGNTYSWEEGRLLTGIENSQDDISYTYSDQGIRTTKTVNGVTTEYHLNGDRVAYEKTGSDYMYFNYDGDGNIFCMNYNGTRYFYERNLQGDVIGILDNTGTKVVSYSYDSWGKQIASWVLNSSYDGLAEDNPYRYRGYRFDNETGMYYLNARYYVPEWGRFFSPDVLVNTTGDINGFNVYAYAGNNPVTFSDDGGFFLDTVFDIISVGISLYDFAKNPSWKTFGMLAYDVGAAVVPGLPGSATIKATALVAGAVKTACAGSGLANGLPIIAGVVKGGGSIIKNGGVATSIPKYGIRQTDDQKALFDLSEEAIRGYKRGQPISQDEAKILDQWASEYNVPQHHQTYSGSEGHFKTMHTHIYNKHVPYK